MFFDLSTPRTRCLQIIVAVALDFRLVVITTFDLVSKFFESHCQLGPVHRRRVLLRSVKLLWLQGASLAGLGLRDIEKDDVRMQLRRGVTVHRPRAVVLEFAGDPLAGSLGWQIAAEPCLHVFLQFAQGHSNTFPMSFSNSVVASYQCRQ